MKVKVKDGVKYGVGGKYAAGTVLEVTEAELSAFQDKLEPLATANWPELVAFESPEPTEAAKKFAAENGVDLTAITGTGKNERITLSDVKAAME